MPQLESSTFASQFFWGLICFLTLWFIMNKFIAPKIADIIRRRRQKIDDYLTAAENFRQTAEELEKRCAAMMKKAELEVEEARLQSVAAMNKEMEETKNSMAQKLQEKINRNEEKLLRTQEEIKSRCDAMALDLAAQIADKLNLKLTKDKITAVLSKDKNNG
ncbi:MAG: hypothetical protein IJ689_00040 [Alphaproteobacteria bacterium]|nr:hypothetical protein [Alphaproteobacteria bacterium]